MKVFVILFILVRTLLGNAEKLDRTYLPPPGSKYAGGSPGAIEVPYELSKDTNANVPSRFYEANTPQFPEISKSQSGPGLNHILRSKPLEIGELSSEKVNVPGYFSNKEIKDSVGPIISEKETTYIENNYQTLKLSSPSYNVEPKDKYAFYGDSQSTHVNDLLAQKKALIEKSANVESMFSEFDKVNESTIYKNSTPKTFNDIKHPVKDTHFLLSPNKISKNLLRMKPHAESDKKSLILKYKNVLTPDGFTYSTDTSNGLHVEQNGTSTNGVKVEGSYSYIGDDGKFYKVTYSADENGFRPLGDHLPTSPPIPEAILKVIEQATRDKEAGIFDDGSYDENKYGYNKYQNEKKNQKEREFQPYKTKSEIYEVRSENALVMENNIKQPSSYKFLKSNLKKPTTPAMIECPNARKHSVEFPQIKKGDTGETIDDTSFLKDELNGSANVPLNKSTIFKSGYFYMRPHKKINLPNMENKYSTTEESLQTTKFEDETLKLFVVPNVANEYVDKNSIVDADKTYIPSTTTTNKMNDDVMSESDSNTLGAIYSTSTQYTIMELGTTLASTETFRDEERNISTLTPQYYTNSWKDKADGFIDIKKSGNFNKYLGHPFVDYPKSLNMQLEDTSDGTTNFYTSVTVSEFYDSATHSNPLYTNAGTLPTTEKMIREDFSGPNQTQKYDMNSGYYY